MARPLVIVAVMLMLGGAQGQSSMRGYDKFITANLQHVKHGNGPDALAGTSPSDIEEKQAVQKLFGDYSMSPISLSAIGIGLLSLVMMLGVRLRRELQPAAILANSAGLGPDMPLNTSSALGENAMEMKSQDAHVKCSAARVGWGQLSSQNSHSHTPCYAGESKADLIALQNSLPGPPSYFDPLEFGGNATLLEDFGFDRETEDGTQISFRIDTEEKVIGWLRHAELKHGRVAMAAFLGFTAQCTPLVSGEHNILPYHGYVAGCTPQEQWDNIPLYGKLQILVLIGMLESYGRAPARPRAMCTIPKAASLATTPRSRAKVSVRSPSTSGTLSGFRRFSNCPRSPGPAACRSSSRTAAWP